jgi:hypothetical protein
VTLLVLALIACLSGCSEAASNNAAANAAYNASANTANANLAPASTPVETHLREALYAWAPEQDYPPQNSLNEIWTRSGKHPWKYYPKGASSLLSGIKADDFFETCQRALKIELEQFQTSNGDIKTVKDLYDKLYDCPN